MTTPKFDDIQFDNGKGLANINNCLLKPAIDALQAIVDGLEQGYMDLLPAMSILKISVNQLRSVYEAIDRIWEELYAMEKVQKANAETEIQNPQNESESPSRKNRNSKSSKRK